MDNNIKPNGDAEINEVEQSGDQASLNKSDHHSSDSHHSSHHHSSHHKHHKSTRRRRRSGGKKIKSILDAKFIKILAIVLNLLLIVAILLVEFTNLFNFQQIVGRNLVFFCKLY